MVGASIDEVGQGDWLRDVVICFNDLAIDSCDTSISSTRTSLDDFGIAVRYPASSVALEEADPLRLGPMRARRVLDRGKSSQ